MCHIHFASHEKYFQLRTNFSPSESISWRCDCAGWLKIRFQNGKSNKPCLFNIKSKVAPEMSRHFTLTNGLLTYCISGITQLQAQWRPAIKYEDDYSPALERQRMSGMSSRRWHRTPCPSSSPWAEVGRLCYLSAAGGSWSWCCIWRELWSALADESVLHDKNSHMDNYYTPGAVQLWDIEFQWLRSERPWRQKDMLIHQNKSRSLTKRYL